MAYRKPNAASGSSYHRAFSYQVKHQNNPHIPDWFIVLIFTALTACVSNMKYMWHV